MRPQKSNSLAWSVCVVLLFGTFVGSGCASAPKNELTLKGLYLPTLHYRRPLGRAADPQAHPDEKAFRSDPPPNERFDCAPATDLLEGVDLDAVMACLVSLNEPIAVPSTGDAKQDAARKPEYAKIRYAYRRSAQPELELIVPPADSADANATEENRAVPQCIRDVLPKIRVPRELIYQSAVDPKEPPVCYATRLNVEEDLFIGIWEMNKVALKLDFPLTLVPNNHEETRAVLLTWALAPIWEEKLPVRTLKARVLPDRLCDQCMTPAGKTSKMLHGLDTRPPLWPPAF